MVRCDGLYANARRGKVRKANRAHSVLGLAEEAPPPLTSKGWAEMIRKVYEVDPLICPRCGGKMKIVARGKRITPGEKAVKCANASLG